MKLLKGIALPVVVSLVALLFIGYTWLDSRLEFQTQGYSNRGPDPASGAFVANTAQTGGEELAIFNTLRSEAREAHEAYNKGNYRDAFSRARDVRYRYHAYEQRWTDEELVKRLGFTVCDIVRLQGAAAERLGTFEAFQETETAVTACGGQIKPPQPLTATNMNHSSPAGQFDGARSNSPSIIAEAVILNNVSRLQETLSGVSVQVNDLTGVAELLTWREQNQGIGAIAKPQIYTIKDGAVEFAFIELIDETTGIPWQVRLEYRAGHLTSLDIYDNAN